MFKDPAVGSTSQGRDRVRVRWCPLLVQLRRAQEEAEGKSNNPHLARWEQTNQRADTHYTKKPKKNKMEAKETGNQRDPRKPTKQEMDLLNPNSNPSIPFLLSWGWKPPLLGREDPIPLADLSKAPPCLTNGLGVEGLATGERWRGEMSLEAIFLWETEKPKDGGETIFVYSSS